MKIDLKKWNGLIYSETVLAQEIPASSSEYRCWVCIFNTQENSWSYIVNSGIPHPFIRKTEAPFSVVKFEVLAWQVEYGDGISGIFNSEYEDAADEAALYEILERKGYAIDLFVEEWKANVPF